ncbi:MDR/zinc-dependent alcohol dehydrogenase-like family protein [Thermogladius sp. 4427co]|uniref:MDR/zinc-dependent alcohol dehydrogenase-like family protein n=1 Tax=Thermogladius sp. 4427co TaxID=3450718 RepID=UPI003F78EBAE
MKALVMKGPRDISVEEVPDPHPPPGWALVKTVAVGICGTDKAFYTGSYPLFKKPLIPGHEVSGIVVSDGRLKGRLVVSEINFPCGQCEYCRRGLYTHCPYRKTLGIDFDGGFAEYFIAPETALHPIDGMLDPVLATEVEPLAAVLNAFTQYPPEPADTVAIVGTGNLALLFAEVLKWMGLDPIIIARPGSRKSKYFTSRGFRVIATSEVSGYIRENTPEGLGFDMVIEASGSTSGLDTAIEIARPRGIVHLKSTPGSRFSVDLTRAVVKELRIIGTRCGTFREFRKAIELLSKGVVKPAVTSVIDGIENSVKAFEKALSEDEMKVVVRV